MKNLKNNEIETWGAAITKKVYKKGKQIGKSDPGKLW